MANCKLLIFFVIWPVITAKTYSYEEYKCEIKYNRSLTDCKNTIKSKLKNSKNDIICKRYRKGNAADDYYNCVKKAMLRSRCQEYKLIEKKFTSGSYLELEKALKTIKCPKREKTCNTTAHMSCKKAQKGDDDQFRICETKERQAACLDKYTHDCEFIIRRRDYLDLLQHKKPPHNCDYHINYTTIKLNYADVVNKECKQTQRCIKHFLDDLRKSLYNLDHLCETAKFSSEIAASCLKIRNEICPPDKTYLVTHLRVIACNLKLPTAGSCDEIVIFSCRIIYVENIVNIRDDNVKNCRIFKKYTDCIAGNVRDCDAKQKFHSKWEPDNCRGGNDGMGRNDGSTVSYDDYTSCIIIFQRVFLIFFICRYCATIICEFLLEIRK